MPLEYLKEKEEAAKLKEKAKRSNEPFYEYCSMCGDSYTNLTDQSYLQIYGMCSMCFEEENEIKLAKNK